MGKPGIDVALDVAAGAAGEFVAYGLVAVAGLGLLQRAQLAQRLELVGAGRDPDRFAQLGFAGGGGRGVDDELGLDDAVGIRVADGARHGHGEQLADALPLRQLRTAADVVGQVLVPEALPDVEPGVFESHRDGAGVHAPRPAPYDTAADTGGADRLAGHGDARSERTPHGAPGRPEPGHRQPRIHDADSRTGRGQSATRRPR
ncbi:hypothetical protein [Streptomyces cacaoi]|uniref:hypothetical protein n=1 Tax=Streptomyces cacaoi TaxID=1898 RepID=UPI001659DBD1|nr:hypothetical protein [Streptomyces cacaoi]